MSEGEIQKLADFMSGPDARIFGRFIGYFSTPGKYLHPRELKEFWESLTLMEQSYYRHAIWTVKIA